MKNEVMLQTSAGTFYFDTKYKTASEALADIVDRSKDMGFNIDNVRFNSVIVFKKSNNTELDRIDSFSGITIKAQLSHDARLAAC